MRFRSRLFTLVAGLAMLWMIYGLSAVSNRPPVSTDGAAVGQAVGSTITVALFACTGVPVFVLALFLSWRNRVGLREQVRHQEKLTALRHHGE